MVQGDTLRAILGGDSASCCLSDPPADSHAHQDSGRRGLLSPRGRTSRAGLQSLPHHCIAKSQCLQRSQFFAYEERNWTLVQGLAFPLQISSGQILTRQTTVGSLTLLVLRDKSNSPVSTS